MCAAHLAYTTIDDRRRRNKNKEAYHTRRRCCTCKRDWPGWFFRLVDGKLAAECDCCVHQVPDDRMAMFLNGIANLSAEDETSSDKGGASLQSCQDVAPSPSYVEPK